MPPFFLDSEFLLVRVLPTQIQSKLCVHHGQQSTRTVRLQGVYANYS
jgi:hypothetical protein